jgi:hypothetical protein
MHAKYLPEIRIYIDLPHCTMIYFTKELKIKLFRDMEGRSLFRALRYTKRYVKMSCKLASLSVGAPLGNREGIRLPGLLRERKVYLGFLLGPRGH